MSMFGYDPGYRVAPFIGVVWGELGSDGLASEQDRRLLAAETTRIENMIRRRTPSRTELCRAYASVTGSAPDYLTDVALVNFAKAQTELMVLDSQMFALLQGRDAAPEPLTPSGFAVARALRDHAQIAAGAYADGHNILAVEIECRLSMAAAQYRSSAEGRAEWTPLRRAAAKRLERYRTLTSSNL